MQAVSVLVGFVTLHVCMYIYQEKIIRVLFRVSGPWLPRANPDAILSNFYRYLWHSPINIFLIIVRLVLIFNYNLSY